MPAVSPLVFFGTPEFAVPTLEALAAAGRRPALIVAQPARPAGRGRRLADPPVARWARAHEIALAQPERVREAEFLAALRNLGGVRGGGEGGGGRGGGGGAGGGSPGGSESPGGPAGPGGHRPAVAVVVAFGQIFPPDLLALPRLGCINLHASLLPRHRGAAPIQAAIAAGDERTGVTTMRMEEGLDSGPILLQEETPIGPRETAGELAARLAQMGGRLVVETLARLERGELVERAQDAAQATFAPRLARASGRIDWRLDAAALERRLRAFTPWPGVTAELSGEPVKLLAAQPLAEGAAPTGAGAPARAAAPAEAAGQPESAPAPEPGTYLGLVDGALAIACGGGSVLGVSRLQRPGRQSAAAADFARGERLQAGQRFS